MTHLLSSLSKIRFLNLPLNVRFLTDGDAMLTSVNDPKGVIMHFLFRNQ